MYDYSQDNINIMQADCLHFLKLLPSNSIDLIATDPPYYKVKQEDWDRQWANKADFLKWINSVLIECERVLKTTGSFYLFCSPYLAAETELLIGEHLRVLNHIVWRKQNGRHLGCSKASLRKYFPQSERIIFAESTQRRPFCYESVRKHLSDTIKEAGISSVEVNRHTGTKMSGHWFGRSQFTFPSRKHYELLRKLAPGLKPYDKLHAEYKRLRKQHGAQGRKFSVSKDVPFTDVWDFGTVQYYEGKHPCEKPIDLMEHIISASSSKGDTVLDPFVGSGSTPIASRSLGRQFVGCEMGEKEFKQAVARLSE